MPYVHFNVPGRYGAEAKRKLAEAACRAYAEIMETQSWRPNVGISELGEDNLFRLGEEGLERIVMVLVEARRGRPAEQRLRLARRIVDLCVDTLDVPRATVFVEFTLHTADEMYRDGTWTQEWSSDEAGGL